VFIGPAIVGAGGPWALFAFMGSVLFSFVCCLSDDELCLPVSFEPVDHVGYMIGD
jgi:hypothetical protein